MCLRDLYLFVLVAHRRRFYKSLFEVVVLGTQSGALWSGPNHARQKNIVLNAYRLFETTLMPYSFWAQSLSRTLLLCGSVVFFVYHPLMLYCSGNDRTASPTYRIDTRVQAGRPGARPGVPILGVRAERQREEPSADCDQRPSAARGLGHQRRFVKGVSEIKPQYI